MKKTELEVALKKAKKKLKTEGKYNRFLSDSLQLCGESLASLTVEANSARMDLVARDKKIFDLNRTINETRQELARVSKILSNKEDMTDQVRVLKTALGEQNAEMTKLLKEVGRI